MSFEFSRFLQTDYIRGTIIELESINKFRKFIEFGLQALDIEWHDRDIMFVPIVWFKF